MYAMTFEEIEAVSGAGFWHDVGIGMAIAGGVGMIAVGVASAVMTGGLDAPIAGALTLEGAGMISGGVAAAGGGLAAM